MLIDIQMCEDDEFKKICTSYQAFVMTDTEKAPVVAKGKGEVGEGWTGSLGLADTN